MSVEFPPLPVDDTVLVLTHMQNEFWHPEGPGYQLVCEAMPSEDVLDRIKGVVSTARHAGVPIIFHQESFRPGHPELRERRGGYLRGSGRVLGLPEHGMAVRGHWATQTLEDLAPVPGRAEFVIENPRVDPFTCTDFDLLLRNLGRHILLLAGIATDFGIEMTARSACERDYGVAILSDCIDRMLGDYSQQTIDVLLPYYGRVTTSDVILEEIQNHCHSPVPR